MISTPGSPFLRHGRQTGKPWRAWLLAGVMWFPCSSSSQTGLPPAEPGFGVVTWDSGGGVPEKFTTAMARTPDGYLWLGTQVGLLRFDGVRFVTITTNTTPALGDNRITSLLVDRGGDLWIATQGGTLSRRQAGELAPVPLDPRLRGDSIESLAATESGGVWLVTGKSGLVRLVNGNCDFSNSTSNLTSLSARSMVRLGNGEWWALARRGLITLNDGTWKSEPFGLKPRIWFWALAPTRQGSGLWLATTPGTDHQRGSRVLKIEGGNVVQELAPYPWPQDARFSSITSIIEDGQGRVWVATHLNGVFYWQPERGWHELKSAEGRFYIQVEGFLADGEGLLWMATRNGMLHRITENQVATVPLPPDREKELIVSACITRDGTLWAGTEDAGAFRFRDGHFRQVTNGLQSLNIGALFEDSRSNLWAGTQRGLSRWSGDKFQPVSVGTRARQVYALCEDHHGNLWAGNGLQVVQLRPDGQARVYGRESGLSNSLVLGLAEDTNGRIYASQERSGLFQLKGDRFEQIDGLGPGFGADGYLLPDEDGGLWIATQSKGLQRLHQDEFQSWSFEDGLPNDYLRSVIPDDAGNLWFSASKGIFGCSKKALLDYQRGKGPSVLFWRLGEADGLKGVWTSGFGQPVAARSADGRLWFPDRNVVAVIDPEVVTRSCLDPPPLIEEVVADGVVLPRGTNGESRLLSGVRHVQIYYTSPNLRSPEALRFRYCLEGLDDHWIESGNNRVAHYGELNPGDYLFRVMVGTESGEWMESSAPMALTVLPRWWEKTSVRVIGLLSVTSILVGTAWRMGSVRQRRQVDKLQLQLAREKQNQESESRFRHVVEASPNAMILVNRQGVITLVNTRAEKLFGYARSEMIDRPIETLLPESYREIHARHRSAFFSQPAARAMGSDRELYGIHKDGQEVPVEIGLNPIQISEEMFVLASIVDISERKRNDAELRGLQTKLAHVQRVSTMGHISTAVAHELNQPLGAILSNAEAAEMLLKSDTPPLDAVREILADIRKDDERAGEVIRRMRTLLRMRELSMQPLDFNFVTQEVLMLVRGDAALRKISVQAKLAREPMLLRGDRIHLQQVLLNLIINGMEATVAKPPEERRVVVRTDRTESGDIEVVISDNGSGIPPDQLARLFEPFYTTKKDGMGMGISIARSIIQAHHGRIWADNNPEGGATFRFILPAVKAEPRLVDSASKMTSP